ncbi:MAG: zf-HC2 domain-containing protein [Candidatus Omnitrophota bacterium]
MNCEEVKAIIPAYINHSASEKDIGSVEEHLCICNDCRQFLSQTIDKQPHYPPPKETPVVAHESPVEEETPKATTASKIGVWEYTILGVGVLVLGFFIYLFIKG